MIVLITVHSGPGLFPEKPGPISVGLSQVLESGESEDEMCQKYWRVLAVSEWALVVYFLQECVIKS